MIPLQRAQWVKVCSKSAKMMLECCFWSNFLGFISYLIYLTNRQMNIFVQVKDFWLETFKQLLYRKDLTNL